MLMVLFYIGQEMYACDSECIVEIIPKVKLKKIFHAPEYISGYLNFGSQQLPVIDICQLVENRLSSPSMHTRIIIVQNPNPSDIHSKLGVIVEKATAVQEVENPSLRESVLKAQEFPYFGGVLDLLGKKIQLIQLSELFNLL